MKNRHHTVPLAMTFVVMTGCAVSPHGRVMESASAVELRSYQSRVFETADRRQTLRTVIATLQDLDFVIDKADATLGSISATKLAGYRMRITVTVRPRGTAALLVRANAQHELSAVEDPEPYQNFFAALEKTMFLTAQAVD